ncbi:MAG: metallophosphoesterase [Nautiliaceae bacterium]
MKIGYKSDIHLDFWIGGANNENKIERFVKKILSPKEMDVLIIAGDLGHYNYQNFLLLKVLKKWTKKILFVLGNHDFYLVSNSQKNRYKTSFKRIKEFKEMVSSLEDVYLLDGEMIEIGGVKFFGANSWYDFSVALKKRYSLEYIRKTWEGIMNDAKKIIPKIEPIKNSHS